ncbi:unnamed protein product [Penicillium roqueforti FM164]|uniref:Genomic scaffold, ProqFM164S01 n=1 Tax=Penicillium roqueforti (strain FM164) TaxID=1365484 RepID=W6QFI2_PENRF|nr:unnamed protein product [Penicillium roqueforti FM164]
MDDVLRAVELGATFNFGQLAQAPACLSSLTRMKGHDRSFRLRFVEQLLDIAGTARHLDWTYACSTWPYTGCECVGVYPALPCPGYECDGRYRPFSG